MQHKNEKTAELAIVIGEIIKELRQSRQYSINRFSREYDLDVGNTSRIEKGAIEVKVVTLWKIAEAMNINLSELIKLVEERLGKNFHLIDY